MRPALLLSRAELLARGQEQINRGIKQPPLLILTLPPRKQKGWGGDVGRWWWGGWGHEEQNTQPARGHDPCEVPLVTADLQNFIIGVPDRFIIRRWAHVRLQADEEFVCARIKEG